MFNDRVIAVSVLAEISANLVLSSVCQVLNVIREDTPSVLHAHVE